MRERATRAVPPVSQALAPLTVWCHARYTLMSDSPYYHWDQEEDPARRPDLDLEALDGMAPSTARTLRELDHTKINYELIEQLLETIDDDQGRFRGIEGAVLVFLPGLGEIQTLYTALTSTHRFNDESRYCIIPLHGVLASNDQSMAFKTPPKGVRKIVLATNIAETGVTIPDVVFVIDTARVKETRYREAARLSSLVTTLVSKASARQRAGRAGRVREGFCFRLVTKARYLKLPGHTTPEIRRVPLESLCLHVLNSGMGQPTQILTTALDPPQAGSVTNALLALKEVGAVRINSNADYLLTPLGRHLANMPVDVYIGKMLILASIFQYASLALPSLPGPRWRASSADIFCWETRQGVAGR